MYKKLNVLSRQQFITTSEELLKAAEELLEHQQQSTEKGREVNRIRRVVKYAKQMQKLSERYMVPKQETGKREIKQRPRVLTNDCADFLQVPHDTEMQPLDVFSALNAYICYNPKKPSMERWKYLNEEGRDLHEGRIIRPDETLNQLLHYDEYCQNVAAGIEKKKDGTVIEDDTFYHTLILKLMYKHLFKPKEEIAVEIVEEE